MSDWFDFDTDGDVDGEDFKKGVHDWADDDDDGDVDGRDFARKVAKTIFVKTIATVGKAVFNALF